jgi:hypothetical protein
MLYRNLNEIWQLATLIFYVGVNPEKYRKTFLVY